MVLGVDALSISELGGFNQIIKILSYKHILKEYGITKIILWCNRNLANSINNDNLIQVNLIEKNNLVSRSLWQKYELGKLAREKCDILFAPGGIVLNDFKPYVIMFQNMQVFDTYARRLEGFSLLRLKFFLLRRVQGYSIRNSTGLIFLSENAKDHINNNCKDVVGNYQSKIIPIGVDDFEFDFNKLKHNIHNNKVPLKILYVSTVRSYKHQWNLVYAFKKLIDKGYNLELHLIGGGLKKFIKKMKNAIKATNSLGEKVFYHGNVKHSIIHEYYNNSDIFAYGSSCENFPSIILEAMSFGLPIICSNLRPMTDILGNSAFYFDHDNIDSIANEMERMVNDIDSRKKFSKEVYDKSLKYTWEKNAEQIFEFIRDIANDYYQS